MVDLMDSIDANIKFEYLPNRPFASFSAVKESLTKWGIPPQSMVGQHYGFDGSFYRAEASRFIVNFLNSDACRGNFLVSDGRGGLRSFAPHCDITSVELVPLEATLTDLNIFDKLVGEGRSASDNDNGEIIIRDGGSVVRCLDIFKGNDITVSNHLRALFLLEEDECDFHGALTADDRRQLLVHVMHRVVAGGPLCQWDDEFEPYKDAARLIYRDIVVVKKRVSEDSSGALESQTIAYQVKAIHLRDGSNVPLFPRENDHSNFMYITIHAARRALSVWYSAYWAPF